jgi:tRNA-splicing ligase RtcB
LFLTSQNEGKQIGSALSTGSWFSTVPNRFLRERSVTLISAGPDEVPMAYKNIREVMAAQNDLVTVLGQFDPKLVKMAPSGERPED